MTSPYLHPSRRGILTLVADYCEMPSHNVLLERFDNVQL